MFSIFWPFLKFYKSSIHQLKDTQQALIARIINLEDKELQKEYVADIQAMKGENNMAAMTFIEKYFRDEGRSEGISLGRSEGISLGRREANFEAARKLRAMGMADPDIHRATSLSLEELKAL